MPRYIYDVSMHYRTCLLTSVVISRPRSRDSSALEFFQRSRSWSRDQKAKVLVLVSSNFLEGLELGLELLGKSWL